MAISIIEESSRQQHADGGIGERDPEDRRRSRLQLSAAGTEYLARGRAELAAAMEELLADLTEEERAGLERALPGLRRALA
jgi:DNA-binding MarR family transcriptional regulator